MVDGVGDSPATVPQSDPVPIVQVAGWVQKTSPPPGFDAWTVQLVTSHYTDCALPAHWAHRATFSVASGYSCTRSKGTVASGWPVTPSSTNVKNQYSCTTSPSIYCHGVHRDNLTIRTYIILVISCVLHILLSFCIICGRSWVQILAQRFLHWCFL